MRDEETGRYAVEINPKLVAFYGRSQWTQIDWEQRQLLRSKPLALMPLREALLRSGRSGQEVDGLNRGGVCPKRRS